ncbi:hypothetical protein NGRA_2409 [Nosema granulosis]|uniref:Ribosomal RNA-processing protein 42 n=1 Tax=Nosema granulosis TaxID=83296 RepID=A0A9P6KYG4_9MICR|nr:hypothetical protein NGRA_2409 [Nosema granulosis]
MFFFSKEELLFVREGVLKGIRIDLREALESRSTQISTVENPQADGSVFVSRGHTKLSVSYQFKESADSLLELKLIKNKEDFKEKILDLEKIPETLRRQIENWLTQFKVGLRVDCEIVNDDGNVYETFVFGLRHLLRKVSVPILGDLEKTIESGIVLPEIKTICLFGNVCVVDPLKIEEESCDSSVIAVVENGKIRNMWTNKCGAIDLLLIRRLISNLFIKE